MKSCDYTSLLGHLHYLDSGNLTSEILVLLHGFTGSSRDFLEMPEMILSRYQCLIPDLPGHGKTQVVSDKAAFSTSGQIYLLKQWLDPLTQGKVHLLGYSMGGRLALQFAARNSSHVKSLILVSTTAGIRNANARLARILSDRELARKILSSEPAGFLNSWLAQPLFRGVSERGQKFIAQEVARRLPIQPFGLANSLKYFGGGVMPSIWHRLSEIRPATLVIAGSQDQKYSELATQLVSSLPNASLAILETSHAPIIESPDVFWKQVAQFLALNSRK